MNGTPVLAILSSILMKCPTFVKTLVPQKKFINVVKNWDWGKGLSKIKRNFPNEGFNYLYTSSGLATHPPLRLFCDPEVSIIQLFSKN